jgi:hypothetical protein
MPRTRTATLLLAPLVGLYPLSAHAQEPPARKTITISIGYTAGGSYDPWPPGRTPCRQADPGQPIVVQNMPGTAACCGLYLRGRPRTAPRSAWCTALEQALGNRRRSTTPPGPPMCRVATSNIFHAVA